MSQTKTSIKKTAFLASAACLAASTFANSALAASVFETQSFSLGCESLGDASGPGCTDSVALSFASFDTSLGTLSGVDIELDSFFDVFGANATATVSLAGSVLFSATTFFFDEFDGFQSLLAGSAFTGPNPVVFDLALDAGSANTSSWNGGLALPPFDASPGLLTVTYIFDDTIDPPSEVPLPASFGFLAVGLAGLGLTKRRRRTKT